MVSLLWKGASDGDLAKVQDLLKQSSNVDLEIKDHTGATPLIQAIRNGHVEVVHALLAAGADPNNGSSQGKPENYTSSPAILEALSAARAKLPANGNEVQHQQQQQQPPVAYEGYPPYDPTKGGYYAPVPYPPYPYMNSHTENMPVPPPPGAIHYYPPIPRPEQPGEETPGTFPSAPPNLPPPDIARSIPCRYFPSCRYGSACMFLHPQGPYFQGPLPPPAQYPGTYDPVSPQQYTPAYYPVSPTSFQHGPPHMVAMSPASPHPNVSHQRSTSEQMIPPVPAQFSPNGAPPIPPPVAYPSVTPMSPSYPPTGHLGGLPPMHHPHPPPHQPSQPMYPVPPPPPNHPLHHRPEPYGSYPTPLTPIDQSQMPRSPPLHPEVAEHYGPPPREGSYSRRGGRRSSFGGGSRKPPCLFFPSGRCKNGDDCRFPHVMSDGPRGNSNGGYPSRYPPRGRPPPFSAIEEKMANMTINDNGGNLNGVSRANGADRSPDSPDLAHSGRFPPNGKGYFSHSPKKMNGATNGNVTPPAKQQRVPNADDFPVLRGVAPPQANGHIVNGTLNGGPTAAQILQGAKKGTVSPRNSSPPNKGSKPQLDADPQVEHNLVSS